jgi:hypothetical protein
MLERPRPFEITIIALDLANFFCHTEGNIPFTSHQQAKRMWGNDGRTKWRRRSMPMPKESMEFKIDGKSAIICIEEDSPFFVCCGQMTPSSPPRDFTWEYFVLFATHLLSTF